MKTSVVIDGVTLTRDQVEKALAELNKPEPVDLSIDCVNLTAKTVELGSDGKRFRVSMANGVVIMETAQSVVAYTPSLRDLVNKSLYLSTWVNWELRQVENIQVLIPTKKAGAQSDLQATTHPARSRV